MFSLISSLFKLKYTGCGLDLVQSCFTLGYNLVQTQVQLKFNLVLDVGHPWVRSGLGPVNPLIPHDAVRSEFPFTPVRDRSHLPGRVHRWSVVETAYFLVLRVRPSRRDNNVSGRKENTVGSEFSKHNREYHTGLRQIKDVSSPLTFKL